MALGLKIYIYRYKNKHKPPQVILKYQNEKCIRNKDLNSLVGDEDI